ncbi:hypothetical protein ABIB00_007088 [Bradyrhizobium sp. LB14.3]|uniref:bifunctional DNA primase/polymerase n=1 Tax=Bradyrhizobium sp. LB14.3 TaxID=3156328 RepID=UPI003390C7A6
MLSLALTLAAAGTPVFPCRADNKRPLTSNGFKAASVFPHVLRRWWRDWPDALVGMPTGERTSVWVLDMDSYKGATEADLPHCLPPTRTVTTRSGGKHFYFNHVGLGNSPGRLPASWDVRGQGGFVLVPGNPGYVLDPDLPLAEAPEWLLAMIRPKPYTPRPSQPYQPHSHDHYVDAAVLAELAALSGAAAGSRGTLLNRVSFTLGTFIGAGALDRSEAEHGLLAAAQGCGLIAVDGERPVRATIRRGLDAGSRHPRALPERDNTPLIDVTKLLRKSRASA